jgi:hypothetical protein
MKFARGGWQTVTRHRRIGNFCSIVLPRALIRNKSKAQFLSFPRLRDDFLGGLRFLNRLFRRVGQIKVEDMFAAGTTERRRRSFHDVIGYPISGFATRTPDNHVFLGNLANRLKRHKEIKLIVGQSEKNSRF